jgi:glucan biosynthesis protein C
MNPLWPTADRQNWVGVDVLIWLSHLIRMPLFFLVAGYFTALLLARRGMAGLARQRVSRILIPFVIAWPLVHISMATNIEWAIGAVNHPSGFLVLAREWLALPDPPRMPPRTGHLWFLHYLLLFSVLVWVMHSLELNTLLDRWVNTGAMWLALTLPLLVLPGFALTSAPHPAPESLLPQFWAMLIFGPFFALGLGLYGRLEILKPLQGWLWPGVLFGLVLYGLFLLHLEQSPSVGHWDTLLIAALEAIIAAWGTLACLLAGLRWLTRPNRLMRYLAGSAYWTYLFHLPVLFALQFVLIDQSWPWPLKFGTSIALTLLVCLLSYELLVRRTRLRAWLGDPRPALQQLHGHPVRGRPSHKHPPPTHNG